ncbi:DNA gyrase/topoisomerase IV subunit B [Candidatus Liberibacter americanus]|uniref:DNA topoisomerase (ATP-hydrolyzing) n=1 Tax=Candidatus Liberibacter americanus str. Sao Paulo TaxID=1261131 RepID=U6B5E2_9HYPH|nr:DNA topoisomerase IV subunit B [Candidatus Liberibacter americanus]AHA28175.1 DNA gyrase [Candidatus Liberibacter americanus str. Sao Paulo]EMS35849.1 DNA topoisomerase IV subunit B [Candidatus Liberibacter americanus PW_SP]
MDDNTDLFSKSSITNKETSENKDYLKDDSMNNNIDVNQRNSEDYDASSIRILKGLEPVRMRPGMYIGGTDENALHHLFSEVIDNAMDEVIAGHADVIDVSLDDEGFITVTDNGRGIPVERHPQFPEKSTLEIIMTTLHSGSKFDGSAYEISGGLHGVGISVVNALSETLEVTVIRKNEIFFQKFSRGIPLKPIEKIGKIRNKRGTSIKFRPDPKIFGPMTIFNAATILKMTKSKAYLSGRVKTCWLCSKRIAEKYKITEKAEFYFPGGLETYLQTKLNDKLLISSEIFSGKYERKGKNSGTVEWAIAWCEEEPEIISYCNTIPTDEGGSHEAGLRIALTKGIKKYAELTQNKRASAITSDDLIISVVGILSIFIRNPEFVGQTKNKLSSVDAQRLVDHALRDSFDHYLIKNPINASKLLESIIERSEERLKKRKQKDVNRKTAVRKLRLPGKLSDCSQNISKGTELFIVEGDSAGGSAKQARNRKNQAILPLRGKLLNVASAGADKIRNNQQLTDLIQALGCNTRSQYREEDLRYEKVIIMTDADVDGAHIASLLLTFFYQEMYSLIEKKHLFVVLPPLFKITQGSMSVYARDEAHKEEILKTLKNKGKIEISRFKGLGEMLASQLKETTMDPKKRTLLRVEVNKDKESLSKTQDSINKLMGTKAEERFRFIQERATFADDKDV